jgi:hypothetical protein
LLRRIHDAHNFEVSSEAGSELSSLTFGQFLFLARLGQSCSQSSDDSVYQDEPAMEDSWQYLSALNSSSTRVEHAVPSEIIESLDRNGFLKTNEKIDVAIAARQYKLWKRKELSIDQALVTCHFPRQHAKDFAAWSGTFPNLAVWLPQF